MRYYKFNKKYRLIELEDNMIWLTKTECNIFDLLTKNGKATHEEIYKSVYDINTTGLSKAQIGAIRIQVCRLNKKIHRIGEMKCIRNIGYKFIERGDVEKL